MACTFIRKLKIVMIATLSSWLLAQPSFPPQLIDSRAKKVEQQIKDPSIFRLKPDLIVLSSHRFQKVAADRYNITVYIKNISNSYIKKKFVVCLNDMYSPQKYRVSIPSLGAHATKSVTFRNVQIRLQPYDEVDVKVDCRNDISEMNENNNFRSFIIQ